MTKKEFERTVLNYDAGLRLAQKKNSYILGKKAFRLLEAAMFGGHFGAAKIIRDHYVEVVSKRKHKYPNNEAEYAADEARSRRDLTCFLAFERANWCDWAMYHRIEKELVAMGNPWAGFGKRNPGHLKALKAILRKNDAFCRMEATMTEEQDGGSNHDVS